MYVLFLTFIFVDTFRTDVLVDPSLSRLDSSFCHSSSAARCIRDNGPACQPDLFLLALPGSAIIFNIPDKRGRFGGLWLIMCAFRS